MSERLCHNCKSSWSSMFNYPCADCRNHNKWEPVEAEPDTCEWTYQSCDDCYDTECGKTIQFMTGELSEDDDFKFCPYCGKPIKVKEEDE